MGLHVEVGGPAHLYARNIPAVATAVGIVRVETGEVGALVRFRGGAYAQMNDHRIRPLPTREVIRAMMAAQSGSTDGIARAGSDETLAQSP